jgi:hypothetical protein
MRSKQSSTYKYLSSKMIFDIRRDRRIEIIRKKKIKKKKKKKN